MTDVLRRDIEAGSSPNRPVRRWLRRARDWVRQHPWLKWVYKVLVAVLGLVVMVVGLVLVPLPGPGWLIVFIGVAILGTEFPVAHRLSVWVKRQVLRVWDWWRARRASKRREGESASDDSRTPISSPPA